MNNLNIARSFNSAAKNYSAIAHMPVKQTLQKQSKLLLERELTKLSSCETLLDLGCGPGVSAGDLEGYCQNYIGIDIAQNMITLAEHAHSDKTWLVGDMHALPMADSSVDVIYSNLAFQWSNQQDVLLKELARVLKPGGRVIFSTLTAGSLPEFKRLYKRGLIRGYYEYPTFDMWERLALARGFTFLASQQETVYTKFNQAKELLDSIKGIGAGVLSQSTQSHGLKGKQWYWSFLDAIQQECADGLNSFNLTYQLSVFHTRFKGD